MKGVSDTIWESTGIQTSILLNPDSYISFTGCYCQFTESNFFDITYHCNDVVKTLKTWVFATSFPEDFICLGMSDSKQCSYSSLTFSHSSLWNKVLFSPGLLGNFRWWREQPDSKQMQKFRCHGSIFKSCPKSIAHTKVCRCVSTTVAHAIQQLSRSKDFAVGRRKESRVSVSSPWFRHIKFTAEVSCKSLSLWREVRLLDRTFYRVPTTTFSRHLFAVWIKKKRFFLLFV